MEQLTQRTWIRGKRRLSVSFSGPSVRAAKCGAGAVLVWHRRSGVCSIGAGPGLHHVVSSSGGDGPGVGYAIVTMGEAGALDSDSGRGAHQQAREPWLAQLVVSTPDPQDEGNTLII